MKLPFLEQLDEDLQQSVLNQIRGFWTHHSTAIEGNSLSLGETHHVLMEGLTISGKSLKDHNEVVGHAKAIDLIFQLAYGDRKITFEDLFELHRTVQTEVIHDIYQPIGAWKVEANSTSVVINEQPQLNDTYALPEQVPELMERWLALLHETMEEDVLNPTIAYAQVHAGFVRIHPFCDGNGRMARLLANLSLLKAKLPPLVIPIEQRQTYITLLAQWQLSAGRPSPSQELIVINEHYQAFEQFCQECWKVMQQLIENAHHTQNQRHSSD